MQRVRIQVSATAGIALTRRLCPSPPAALRALAARRRAPSHPRRAAAPPSALGRAQRERIDVPADLPAGAIPAFKSVQPNMTVNYGGGGSGKGGSDLASGSSTSRDRTRRSPPLRAALQGQDGALLPGRDRPDLDGVQPVRREQPEADSAGHRADLRGQDHLVEQLGHHGDQPGCQPAQHPDHHRRPLGLLGHDGELLPVPARAEPSVWTLGSSSTIKWPARPRAGNGNGGVAQIVKSTPGAIGYVDYADAKATGLSSAEVKNKDGNYVAPSPTSASAAASRVTVAPNLTFHAVGDPARSLPDHLPVLGSGLRGPVELEHREDAPGLHRLPDRAARNCSRVWATRRCPATSTRWRRRSSARSARQRARHRRVMSTVTQADRTRSAQQCREHCHAGGSGHPGRIRPRPVRAAPARRPQLPGHRARVRPAGAGDPRPDRHLYHPAGLVVVQHRGPEDLHESTGTPRPASSARWPSFTARPSRG